MSRNTVSFSFASSRSTSNESSSEDTWSSFLLWDVDREFQHAHEAYERWMTKNQRKRSTWECISGSSKEDPLDRSLRLGSRVQRAIQDGQRKFGQKFDKGDATCHTTLSAQLLRLQQEVCVPLLDATSSRWLCPIPYDEILRAARGVRRACFDALQDQMTRLSTRRIEPFLPPPRFSVTFCPFALQLQTEQQTSNSTKHHTRKLNLRDRYDDRESCPHCHAIVSVAAHSGLPQYRCILFASHALSQTQRHDERATFACTSCYKTFDDSYAFLDHVFQKELGSEKSCLKRYSARFSLDARFLESDPRLVEQCLKNCLERERTRTKRMSIGKEMLRL
ncbi:hypothetical protein DPSP01_003400 [Paraphaeosphaeria sporulosa]|uniref:C2H2-type domain-containing protein n=1 Tax=Paraphaeosphaeria sporulosa TaxID=1460663 RepID=A0A177CEB7_9PLEO|nr:uncharacterized protein CC84DRAFT_1148310 [Paraphaeosphaeria sporulosa]OAG05128.1 hypothetical protein CC84DRAFT_1148310 [Paraphaeosphaeria sporulosa]